MSDEIRAMTNVVVRFCSTSSYPLTDTSYLATRMKRDPEATMMRGEMDEGDVTTKRGGNDNEDAEKATDKGKRW